MSESRKEELKATLNRVAGEIKKTGKRVAVKTSKMADVATVRIKLQSVSVKLSEAYENLGKLSYNKLVRDVDNAEKIAEAIERIEELKAEIDTLKKELADKIKKMNESTDD